MKLHREKGVIANWIFHKRLTGENCSKINDPEMGSIYLDFIVIPSQITRIISTRCMGKFQHFSAHVISF